MSASRTLESSQRHWSQALLRSLDAITTCSGKAVSWLTVVMVIATCIVVILRRGFDIGSIALQESVTYMHAAVFLLGMAYTLKRDAHVRVDIFYRGFSQRQQAWTNSLGTLLFLFPLIFFIGIGSWDFVMRSWEIGEASTDSGGVGAVYILKALIPVMALSMGIQAGAELLRNVLFLMNVTDPVEKIPSEKIPSEQSAPEQKAFEQEAPAQ